MLTAGRIVERPVGMPLPKFAQRALFDALGIREQDVVWNFSLDSSNASTFALLYLRPRDMVKNGALVPAQGKWQGKQIISPEWSSAQPRARRVSEVEDMQFCGGPEFALSTLAGTSNVSTLVASGFWGPEDLCNSVTRCCHYIHGWSERPGPEFPTE